jgi:hypothetical protein
LRWAGEALRALMSRTRSPDPADTTKSTRSARHPNQNEPARVLTVGRRYPAFVEECSNGLPWREFRRLRL